MIIIFVVLLVYIQNYCTSTSAGMVRKILFYIWIVLKTNIDLNCFGNYFILLCLCNLLMRDKRRSCFVLPHKGSSLNMNMTILTKLKTYYLSNLNCHKMLRINNLFDLCTSVQLYIITLRNVNCGVAGCALKSFSCVLVSVYRNFFLKNHK